MNFLKNKLKDYDVAKKLKIYRIGMIFLIDSMAVIAILLSGLIYSKVKVITEKYSPALALSQELGTLTTTYYLEQFKYINAVNNEAGAKYKNEIEAAALNITEKSSVLYGMISSNAEQEAFLDAREKWMEYKEQSNEIVKLIDKGERTAALQLMYEKLGSVYDEFQGCMVNLETIEYEGLSDAKKIVYVSFFIIVVIIIFCACIAVTLATVVGRGISKMITEPIKQIEEAIGSMRVGELSNIKMLTYESEDELGTVTRKLRESMIILSEYVEEISSELREIAVGDITKSGDDITDFLGDFSEIKSSLVFILKRFNSTLTEIRISSEHVEADAVEIAGQSKMLSDGATEQAGVIEELTATVDTVVSLAGDSAAATRCAYNQIRSAVEIADVEQVKMTELIQQMEHIMEISNEIGNIITDIESIAAQTNLLSLNASIEATHAGDAGRGFAVVADQIGKLAKDSAKSAVNTRILIKKTMTEIENGNNTAISTSEAFNRIIADMQDFADVAQRTTENADTQAQALAEIGQGIEQLSVTIQNTAASSEQNASISENLSGKAEQLHELVNRFKLF